MKIPIHQMYIKTSAACIELSNDKFFFKFRDAKWKMEILRVYLSFRFGLS